jgi:hypothetical protein
MFKVSPTPFSKHLLTCCTVFSKTVFSIAWSTFWMCSVISPSSDHQMCGDCNHQVHREFWSPCIIITYWQRQSCATHAALNHIKSTNEYFSIIWMWKWPLFLFVCVSVNWLTKRKSKYIEATSFQTLLCFQIIKWLSSLGSQTMPNNSHCT